jgi:phosphoserine phosphatase
MVTFDIDGTLTRGHGWRFLAERTGQLAAYQRSNDRFFQHAASEDEHLRELMQLAAGRTVSEIESVLEATPKMPGIVEAVRDLQARGAHVALLTHNPEYVCAWYRRKFGFEDSAGTDGDSMVEDPIVVPARVRAAKLDGLNLLLRRMNVSAARTAHVGDGWADVPVFRAVGGAVALNSRLPDVRAAADVAVDLDNLLAIVEVLDRLTPRAVRAG